VGTQPGLEPWQFYGPSTRRDARFYLHLLLRPYEQVTVRGVPVKRVERVHLLGHAEPLDFTFRTSVIDQLNADPLGELVIPVPDELLDPMASVLAIDFASPT